MGDARFEHSYARLRASDDRAALLRKMTEEDLVEALASASRHNDPYLANTLATEALNRIRRLRASVRNLGEGVVTLDAEGVTTYANPMAARLLGRPVGEIAGRDFVEVAGLSSRRVVDVALAGQTETRDHESMRRGDGTRFPVLYTTAPIFSSLEEGSGERAVEGVVVAFGDITERKRVEGELRLRSVMLDSLGEAVIAFEPEGRVTFWNRAAERIYGWTAAEAVGRDVSELTVPDDERPLARSVFQMVTGGTPWAGEVVARRKDGALLDVRVTVSPVKDASGRVVALVAVSLDVTERHRAEEESRLRAAMLDSVGEAVVATDAEGRFVYWNAAAERMTGWREEEARGRRASELVQASGRPGMARIARRDGTAFPAHVSEVPVRDRRGVVSRVVSVWVDLTEHERAQAAVEEARAFWQAALDALSSHVAILDERGTIVAVNRAWREFAEENGLTLPHHGVGSSYLGPCDRAAAEGDDGARRDAEGIRATLEGRAAEHFRKYPCHGPTQKRWFVLRASGFRDGQGRRYAVVSHANVTALHRLELVGEALEAITAAAGLATFTTTLDGETLSWNEKATELFGYPVEEAIGRPVDRLLEGTARAEKARIRERIDRGETVRLPRARCHGRGGEEVLVDLLLTPVRGKEGEVVAVSALAKPVDGGDDPR